MRGSGSATCLRGLVKMSFFSMALAGEDLTSIFMGDWGGLAGEPTRALNSDRGLRSLSTWAIGIAISGEAVWGGVLEVARYELSKAGARLKRAGKSGLGLRHLGLSFDFPTADREALPVYLLLHS